MATLAEQMVSDVSVVLLNTAEHAETVTYTPSSGSPRSVVAIVDSVEELDAQAFPDGQHRIRRRRAFVADNATTGVAAPTDKDTVTIDSEAWSVAAAKDDRAGMWELTLVRIESVEKSAQGYRLPRGI